MNIIKQFDDYEFFERHFTPYFDDDELSKGYWRWGLGDDGDLYCQCSAFNDSWNNNNFDDPNEWYPYSEACYPEQLHVLFEDMVKIVKEFGKLLVWL